MNIKETQTAEASLKGFTVTGKVVAVYEGKRIQGTKNDKAYDFVATSIKLEDDTGSIYVQFTDKDEELQSVKDKTITCISCSINEYVNKQGITQRSIRANEFSSEITLEDPAHPELPKTVPIKDELTKEELKEVKETTKPIEPSTWDLKDVKIIRQHCETDATSLVIKYFKGTLDEAIAQVITTSNILVSSVYQGLKFPIKVEEEIQEEKPEHTKKFEHEMEQATEQNTESGAPKLDTEKGE